MRGTEHLAIIETANSTRRGMPLLMNSNMNSAFRRKVVGSLAFGVVSALCFFNWGRNRTIYPPDVITTKNRLYPTYIIRNAEIQDVVLTKAPLLLNFTYQGDKNCNRLTQALFDLLSDAKKYPLDSSKYPVELANVACDSPEARELMLTYGVSKVPSVVCLKKQIPIDLYVPGDISSGFNEEHLSDWIKRIAAEGKS